MMFCKDCLYFLGEAKPCAAQPLACIAPDDEFCSEFVDARKMRKY